MKWKTQLLINIVYDIAFKSSKRFKHSDIIYQSGYSRHEEQSI